MKKVYFFGIIILLLACNSKSSNLEKATALSTNINNSGLTAAKLKYYFNGVWVAKNYVDDVARTQSPYSSFRHLDNVASFSINLKDDTKDSLVCGYSLNNHEGAEFTLYLKSGHAPNFLKTSLRDNDKGYWYELGYLPGNDTVLVLYAHNKNGKQVNLNYYQKVMNKNTDFDIGQGITFITNKTLISGTYYSVYPVIQNPPIIFKNNGDVYGLESEGIKTYYISTDFASGPANNLDQISFNLYTKEQKDYLFKFAGDTLKVFDTAFSSDSSMLRWGELRYKLVRKR